MDDHQHLSDLNATQIAWTLTVRVTRMWRSLNGHGEVSRHNLILLDYENMHMVAVMSPAIWNQFAGLLNPGTLYRIRNIGIMHATGLYRTVRNTNCIRFLPITIVEVVPVDTLMIPRHKFELTSLSAISKTLLNSNYDEIPVYSTDVIGVVEDLEPQRTILSIFGSRDMIRFRLSDGETSHRVYFVGNFPPNIELLYQDIGTESKIVILAYVHINIYQGNLPSTSIFINIDYPDVVTLRQRLLNIDN
ncbi:uncharacterized protein LOC141685751 [Apium graveolens]|uniref:uncharacterized protein LOC141685751 n=1 Tax=Apium graveolens TaxID=4045 RepID=UPI003D7A5445